MLDNFKKVWTKESEEQLVQLRQEGKSLSEIATIMNKTYESCKKKYRRLMLKEVKNDVKENIENVEEKKLEIDVEIDIAKRVPKEVINNVIEEVPKVEEKIEELSEKPVFTSNKNFTSDSIEEERKQLESGHEGLTFLDNEVYEKKAKKDTKNLSKKIKEINEIKETVVKGAKCNRCGEPAEFFMQHRDINKEHDYGHAFLCQYCMKEIRVLLNTPVSQKNNVTKGS